ncbi:hypothetical protein [Pseudovibrio sp. Ad26]|uniref:hypothetical protein n=1 Tax=Pseudovibrio sp. Ad26 TaxID=989410 RepID=UPI0007B2F71F|nr:hypothetical protein [Pseudovibrio sp. Ad26]KZL16995.1 hypothetical protein PsAD26_00153 [Pseudovibrio sp. Ad26]
MGQFLQTLLRILLCLVALNTSASQAQPLFDLDDHFTFNPQGKYQPRLIGLFETDRNNTSGAAEVITPVFQDSHGMFFADVRSGNSSDAVYLISAGGGLRHFVRPNLIGSTYIFMNYKEDYERDPATAVTTGIEFLANNYEARFNAQFPTSKVRILEPEPGSTDPRESIPLLNLSGEIGYDLPGTDDLGFGLRIYAGGFYRTANNIEEISGAQGRFEISRAGWFGLPGLKTTFVGQIRYHSDINYPIGAFQLRIGLPIVKYWKGIAVDNYNELSHIERRMTERVRRPLTIHNRTRRIP